VFCKVEEFFFKENAPDFLFPCDILQRRRCYQLYTLGANFQQLAQISTPGATPQLTFSKNRPQARFLQQWI
jgi:hypothetical protein